MEESSDLLIFLKSILGIILVVGFIFLKERLVKTLFSRDYVAVVWNEITTTIGIVGAMFLGFVILDVFLKSEHMYYQLAVAATLMMIVSFSHLTVFKKDRLIKHRFFSSKSLSYSQLKAIEMNIKRLYTRRDGYKYDLVYRLILNDGSVIKFTILDIDYGNVIPLAQHLKDLNIPTTIHTYQHPKEDWGTLTKEILAWYGY